MRSRKKKPSASWQIWEIVYPLIVYYLTTIIVMNLSMAILGNDPKYYMICQILVGIVTLPVVWFSFYKRDSATWGLVYAGCFDCQGQSQTLGRKQKVLRMMWAILISILIGTGINNIILMSPIAEASQGFAQANEAFFAGTVLPEVIGSGILTPMLEELIYRGVIGGRLRRLTTARNMMLFSALIFAIMHFNMVQFVYAFFMGLLFAWFLEHTGNLWNCIAAHMAVNLLAIVRTESGWLFSTVDGSVSAWLISLAMLFLGVGILDMWQKRIAGK